MALDEASETEFSAGDDETEKMPVLFSYADLVEGMKKIEGDEHLGTVRYLSKDVIGYPILEVSKLRDFKSTTRRTFSAPLGIKNP